MQKRAKRVRTPIVLQMEAVECGAAALAAILEYYGRRIPLAKLRQDCGISRDGTSAWHILKVAKHYGLTAKGLKLSLDQLKALPPPYIVFWGFNHFLVVEGFGRQKVYLNDPAVGRRTVPLSEFSQTYTGIALTMQPGPGFQPGGQQRHIVAALGVRLKNAWGTLLFCLLAGLLLTLPRLAAPTFAQVFIDEVLIQQRYHWLRPLLLGMLLMAGLHYGLARLRLTYLRRLMVKLSATLSTQFFWHILRLPLGFYAQRYAGEVSSRLLLNDRVADVLSGRLATTLIDAVMMVFYLLIMLQYDATLAAIAVTFAGVNILALRWLAQSHVDANLRVAQTYGKVVGTTVSGIQTIETVKASGLEADLFARFTGYYAKAVNAQQTLGLQAQLLMALPTLLLALAIATVWVVGGLQVMNGQLSIGMLVAYQSLTLSFLAPVNKLVNFGSTLQELEADLDRLDDVLGYPIDPEASQSEASSDHILAFPYLLKGTLEAQQLCFGYSQTAPPLIQDFDLVAQPGQRIAIAGKSGSGKSTLAKLLCGLYQPWQGEIYLDGVVRRHLPRSVLAQSIAMVEQEIFLFSGSVRDNLTLWDPTIPEADLVQACQDAEIHDLIMSLPGNYEAQLAEAGRNLSGGQRQRLEIARALVRNPAVLILDEATSALDPETERQIEQNLRRRHCTCILIAHRLSTLRDCDEIIVLEQGQVVQRGTHAALWQQGGAYRDLIQSEEV